MKDERQLGTCDSQQNPGAHEKSYECVNWKPLDSSSPDFPVDKTDEGEARQAKGPLCEECNKPSRAHYCYFGGGDGSTYHPSERRAQPDPSPSRIPEHVHDPSNPFCATHPDLATPQPSRNTDVNEALPSFRRVTEQPGDDARQELARKAALEIALSVFGCEDNRPWSKRFKRGWDSQRNAVAGKAQAVIERVLTHQTADLRRQLEQLREDSLAALGIRQHQLDELRRQLEEAERSRDEWKKKAEDGEQIVLAVRSLAKMRYSRNHGLPNPTPAFPTHVEFSLPNWDVIRSLMDEAFPASRATEEK